MKMKINKIDGEKITGRCKIIEPDFVVLPNGDLKIFLSRQTKIKGGQELFLKIWQD